ncbi:MAG: hypothetical protein ACJA2S_005315 [Cyclobacteriaceae bacterium]|jgi:hypothetical protein
MKIFHTIDDENVEPKSDKKHTKNGNSFLFSNSVCV